MPILFDVHDLLERFAELRIEDGVDHRIDEAVHVAQPRGDDERVHARTAVGLLQLRAQGVQHVAREERHPAEQKDAWAEILYYVTENALRSSYILGPKVDIFKALSNYAVVENF